ncbi:MAG TPA: hypothetical protein QF901_15205 [Gammaproteobacteria bacterium]|jgi:hypothetical protein|nr:hypothetical protein [Gammaproteobacteria bacterium]|tara:strand:+ start:134 stop:478 length:345 start_codon:yes stop_codon:yes gene_type:complete
MNQSDRDFLELVRGALDDDLETTEVATTARLARIRSDAILRREGRADTVPRFAPALAFAASTIMVALFLYVPDGSSPRFESDLELIEYAFAEGELELVEDLDFYRWLDAGGYAG